ncbi:MAG: hypothetical protein ACOCXJ_05215 [Planctomycetota bacterium]
MNQMSEQELIERIRKIEALFDQAATPGEQAAAAAALGRVQEHLLLQEQDEAREFSFSISDPWQQRVFIALLRKHDIRPYRYPRQKRQTVVARLPHRLLDQVIWPEFQQIAALLSSHLAAVADRIIATCIHEDTSDLEQAPAQLPAG